MKLLFVLQGKGFSSNFKSRLENLRKCYTKYLQNKKIESINFNYRDWRNLILIPFPELLLSINVIL